MNKFYSGQEINQRSICDHNCIFTGTVIKRTAKRVTVKTPMYGVKTVAIKTDEDGNESCYPMGTYSMAPRFSA